MKSIKPKRAVATMACALMAGAALAVNDNDTTRRADSPDKPLTSAEIVAKPRRATVKTPVPDLARI